jgi:hypothetical protein
MPAPSRRRPSLVHVVVGVLAVTTLLFGGLWFGARSDLADTRDDLNALRDADGVTTGDGAADIGPTSTTEAADETSPDTTPSSSTTASEQATTTAAAPTTTTAAPVPVPDVVGIARDDAVAQLQAAGLSPRTDDATLTDLAAWCSARGDIDAGEIAAVDPAPGTLVAPGSMVRPSVAGYSCAQAGQAGLYLQTLEGFGYGPENTFDEGLAWCAELDAGATGDAFADSTFVTQMDGTGADAGWRRVAAEQLCPQHQRLITLSIYGNGSYTVGGPTDTPGAPRGIPVGNYATTREGISNCYWERSTAGGDIIDNNFITFAAGRVTVTVRASDGGFTTNGCGTFIGPL